MRTTVSAAAPAPLTGMASPVAITRGRTQRGRLRVGRRRRQCQRHHQPDPGACPQRRFRFRLRELGRWGAGSGVGGSPAPFDDPDGSRSGGAASSPPSAGTWPRR